MRLTLSRTALGSRATLPLCRSLTGRLESGSGELASVCIGFTWEAGPARRGPGEWSGAKFGAIQCKRVQKSATTFGRLVKGETWPPCLPGGIAKAGTELLLMACRTIAMTR